MAYIRDKKEERTGYQTGSPLCESTDNQCDFAMVYRLNDTAPERIASFRNQDYVVHFMTGIAWGNYIDYLSGEYDGTSHWDEAQTDRDGNIIAHGKDVPYMVPTVAFADYLTEKLKPVVDAGIQAIHVEEPEFWDRAGYSEAFKREYESYYGEKWTPPHESTDSKYKCSRLKAYLYTRTIDRVSAGLKEYSLRKYGKKLRFYVPTHSLLNYTQWKIVSPEGKLSDIPYVDGCIAQVWTGTSREKNWFNGEYKERTFETAYLEYGVMQELVKGTGRKMWFLHDPIEDNPVFDWNDYRKNYFCTVAASLLHPKINTYEICPWPNRVFEEKYPKNSPEATEIPAEYATVLNNTFNTLGTIENCEENGTKIGILTGDCQLYQREYPDCLFSTQAKRETGTVLRDDDEIIEKFRTKLFNDTENNRELMLKYMSSSAFPGFYSLALPLLKYGIPVRPVLLDNARRFTGYLDDYSVLVLSYEFMKPDYPDINNAIAQWVRKGGTLIYIGDGSDPFHSIKSWWNENYSTPAQHLFDMLEINPQNNQDIFSCGEGTVAVWKENPCVFSFNIDNANLYREFVFSVIEKKHQLPEIKNYLMLERGNYIVAAVMDESVSDEPLEITGNFADMFTENFEITQSKVLYENDKCLLFDLDKIPDEKLCIIGTSVRIFELYEDGEEIKAVFRGAGNFKANIRIKVPEPVREAFVDGEKVQCEYDELTQTVLVSFDSIQGERNLTLR